MKVKIELECTPQEARTFLGLPDVEALNAAVTEEIRRRMESNMTALQPEEMMKNWTTFGLAAQEQFRNLMTGAAGAANSTDKS
jgi:hypothetical protein